MSVSNATSYKHTPLPDPGAYIRLVEVLTWTRDEDEPVECLLTNWAIDDAPDYHAISYLCGPDTPVKPIQVGNQLMLVRDNCLEVLKQITCFKTGQYYWIDAICIHQNDDNEKSCQVSIMGDIFARAKHVLAYIGSHYDDSEFAMRMVAASEEYSSERGLTPGSEPRRERSDNDWLATLSSTDVRRFTQAMAALTRRPYFQRVWIVQELLVAQSVSICCGDQRQSWQAYISIMMRLHHGELSVRTDQDNMEMYRARKTWDPLESMLKNENRKPLRLPSPSDLGLSQGLVDAIPAQGLLFDEVAHELISRVKCRKDGGFQSQRQSMRVWEAIRFSHSRRCQDARDSVYGVLSLVDWGGAEPIKPNYSMSTFDLAIDILGYDLGAPIGRRLLSALRLDSTDVKVDRGMILRRDNLSSMCHDLRKLEPLSRHAIALMMVDRFEGFQLQPNAAWYLDEAGVDESFCRVKDSETHTSHGFACIAARTGDWIVSEPFVPFKPESPTPSSLVLRQTGSMFAIVGQAVISQKARHMTGTWSHQIFEVAFDREDFVVYTAAVAAVEADLAPELILDSPPQSTALIRLKTGVCRAPFIIRGAERSKRRLRAKSSRNRVNTKNEKSDSR